LTEDFSNFIDSARNDRLDYVFLLQPVIPPAPLTGDAGRGCVMPAAPCFSLQLRLRARRDFEMRAHHGCNSGRAADPTMASPNVMELPFSAGRRGALNRQLHQHLRRLREPRCSSPV